MSSLLRDLGQDFVIRSKSVPPVRLFPLSHIQHDAVIETHIVETEYVTHDNKNCRKSRKIFEIQPNKHVINQ